MEQAENHEQREIQQVLFESNFAHELAGGLASLLLSVVGAAELSGKELQDINFTDLKRLREYTESIRWEVEAQLFQALNILSVRFPDQATGVIEPTIEYKKPVEFLQSMLPPYVEYAKRRSIEIVMANSDDAMCMPEIEVEINTLRRVFHNLLSNAIKYSYRGRTERWRYVRIWCKRDHQHGDSWAVCFENYGIGLTKEERDRVFALGFRGAGARHERAFGSGIGLWVANRCIALHGGRIRLESSNVHGNTSKTTVSLVFPRVTGIRRRLVDFKHIMDG